jgi:predicted metalloprotease with PDZ domain
LRLHLLPLLALAFPLAAQNSAPEGPVAPLADNPARDIPYPGTLTLDVDATDTRRGIFRVRETIPVAGPGPLTLRYPQWLPGNHGPSGPIEAVAGLRISAGGRPVAWRRDPVDMYAFHVEVPSGAAAIDIAFDYLSNTPGAIDRTEITADLLNLQWDKVALYPAGHYVRRIMIRPSVTLPAGWTGIAALDGETREGNRLSYAVTSFETLLDSPMFAGRHYRKWDLGSRVTLNAFADRPEDLAATPQQIAAHRSMVTQAIRAFGPAHFDRYEFLLALSDELSGIGLEHHRSSENATPRGYFTDWANSGAYRGVVPHEFTHSWNGKFRRPADLWTPDYRTPMRNSLLWVYEGQTSYWDIVLGARSGVIQKEVALGEIASTAANYTLQPGRSWRPLADTTNQPIVSNRRAPEHPTWQRGNDYYSESALIWIDADTLIREKTRGRRSLDDFARAFFGIRAGDWGQVTYTRADLVAALNRVAPHDWEGFFRARIDQPGAPPPVEGIARGGYRIVWKDEPNAYDASAMKRSKSLDLSHSLGLTVGKAGAVTNVVWDSPPFAQGIVPGATLVAVNGREYSDDELKGAIKGARGGTEPIRLLVKERGRFREVALAYHGGLRWPHLERTGSGPASLDRMLAPIK